MGDIGWAGRCTRIILYQLDNSDWWIQPTDLRHYKIYVYKYSRSCVHSYVCLMQQRAFLQCICGKYAPLSTFSLVDTSFVFRVTTSNYPGLLQAMHRWTSKCISTACTEASSTYNKFATHSDLIVHSDIIWYDLDFDYLSSVCDDIANRKCTV